MCVSKNGCCRTEVCRDKQSKPWSNCADTQTDLGLCCSHMAEGPFPALSTICKHWRIHLLNLNIRTAVLGEPCTPRTRRLLRVYTPLIFRVNTVSQIYKKIPMNIIFFFLNFELNRGSGRVYVCGGGGGGVRFDWTPRFPSESAPETAMKQSTVDSRYLEFQGTHWNTSRYPHLDISELREWGKQ